MTEAEWLAWCADPEPMLRVLPTLDRASERKLRLFAVACCRLLFRTVQVRASAKHAVEVAERYADGASSLAELRSVGHYAISTAEHACMNATEEENGVVLAYCAALNAAWAATQPGTSMPNDGGVSAARLTAEQALQCGLLREIIGNPFRPVAFDPAWRTSTALSLARAAYDERQFPAGTLDPERLAVLADALMDAGCDNEDLLGHLRSPGLHVRGCWAVDLILGKE